MSGVCVCVFEVNCFQERLRVYVSILRNRLCPYESVSSYGMKTGLTAVEPSTFVFLEYQIFVDCSKLKTT